MTYLANDAHDEHQNSYRNHQRYDVHDSQCRSGKVGIGNRLGYRWDCHADRNYGHDHQADECLNVLRETLICKVLLLHDLTPKPGGLHAIKY